MPQGRRGGAVGILTEVLLLETQNGTNDEAQVLLFCGGLGEGGDNLEKADCWRMDFVMMKWEAAPSLLQATAFPAYSAVNQSFYVAGGYYKGKVLDQLQVKWQLLL